MNRSLSLLRSEIHPSGKILPGKLFRKTPSEKILPRFTLPKKKPFRKTLPAPSFLLSVFA